MTSPFDSLTGLHHLSIDLTDNTDSGFYAAGSTYEVVLTPDETVDTETIIAVIARFEIGPGQANVTQIEGSDPTDQIRDAVVDDATRIDASLLNVLSAGMRGMIVASGTIGSTGNSTTALHLTGLPFGNDEINDHLLVIFDVSTSEYHARYIEDWADTGDLATVATLPFTPQNATDTYWIFAIKRDNRFGFTVAGQVDANVQYVNDGAVTGNGEIGSEWGPA